MLKEQLGALRSTLLAMQSQQALLLAEVRALRGKTGVVETVPVDRTPPAVQPLPRPAPPMVPLVELDPVEFPPLAIATAGPSRADKGKQKEKEVVSPVSVSVACEVPVAGVDATVVDTSPPALKKKTAWVSYQDTAISLGFGGSDLEAARIAMSRLSRRPAQIGKNGDKLCRVYVQGIGRMAISKVRTYLKDLRFRTSRILNVSFLGTMTAEFLVTGDYVGGFKRRIETFSASTGWKVIAEFDATTAADPAADGATKKRIQTAFTQRVHKIIQSTNRPAVKAFYETWLQGLNIPLPTPPAPSTPVPPVAPPADADVQDVMAVDEQTDPVSVPGDQGQQQ